MHSMQVKCEVEADPAESVKFHWTYNNTRNVSPVSNVICDVESWIEGLEMEKYRERFHKYPQNFFVAGSFIAVKSICE